MALTVYNVTAKMKVASASADAAAEFVEACLSHETSVNPALVVESIETVEPVGDRVTENGRVEIKMQRIYVAVDNETNQEIGRSTDFAEASRLAGIFPAGRKEA